MGSKRPMLSEGTSKETVGTESQGKKLQALAVNEDHHFFQKKELSLLLSGRRLTDLLTMINLSFQARIEILKNLHPPL